MIFFFKFLLQSVSTQGLKLAICHLQLNLLYISFTHFFLRMLWQVCFFLQSSVPHMLGLNILLECGRALWEKNSNNNVDNNNDFS